MNTTDMFVQPPLNDEEEQSRQQQYETHPLNTTPTLIELVETSNDSQSFLHSFSQQQKQESNHNSKDFMSPTSLSNDWLPQQEKLQTLSTTQTLVELSSVTDNSQEATVDVSLLNLPDTSTEQTTASFYKDEPHHPQQRLSATQVLELLTTNNLNLWQVPFVFPKPPLDAYDISSIYSKKAWSELRELLTTGTQEVIMCVNGGSSAAGAGNIETDDRFHYLFASWFQNVTVVDRSHGSRNSLHSAHLAHTFLPMNTDIILWEFAVNDAAYYQLENETIMLVEARNQLIQWLEHVAWVAKQRQARPPLVILVYLWNESQFVKKAPFARNLVFEAHRGLAEQYDFVVGQVNAAKYYEFFWDDNTTQAYFMADIYHPNHVGHRLLHYLLHDLVMDEQRMEQPRQVSPTTSRSYTWICGDDTPQKRLLRDLVQNRKVIASFTTEEPKNEELLPGMLLPSLVGGDDEIRTQTMGKKDSLRSDRKYAAILPCCGQQILRFDNILKHGLVEAIQPVLYPNTDGLSLYVDGVDITDKLISCRNVAEWQCIFSDVFENFYYWFILEAPRNVSTIGMCNHGSTCGTDSQQLALQTLTLFGEG
jgi:hypothetical protein